MLSFSFAKVELYIQDWRALFATREKREQLALKVLGAVLALAFFYGLILSPLYTHLQHQRLQIKQDERNLAWMQGVNKVLSSSSAKGLHAQASMTPMGALTVLQAAIQASPLASGLKSLKQNGDQAIALQFQAVSFDGLMLFLGDFQVGHPFIISELTVSSAGTTPGMVNVDLIFHSIA